MTDPPGATCQLQRNGETIAVVNPTPGTANISKSTRDIAVNCTRPGHLAAAAAMPPRFQPMMLGNILLGGVVGLVVDASSGAMSQYEPNVTLVLAPESFKDGPARESFFLSRIEEAQRNYGGRIDTVNQDCPPNNRAPCDGRVADLERERDAEVARPAARGNGPGLTAPAPPAGPRKTPAQPTSGVRFGGGGRVCPLPPPRPLHDLQRRRRMRVGPRRVHRLGAEPAHCLQRRVQRRVRHRRVLHVAQREHLLRPVAG